MTARCPTCGPITGHAPRSWTIGNVSREALLINHHHDTVHGQQARDEGITRVTTNSDQADITVVDRAILTVAARGKPFSANDCRDLIPPLRSNNLVGARFNALARAGRIRRYGKETVQSSDVATHAHDIKVWVSTDVAEDAA